jgi:hypothetical protein
MKSNKSMFISSQTNCSLIKNKNNLYDISLSYHLLAKQMEIINTFLLEYSLGNYQNVINMFTRDKNYKLVVALKLLAVNPQLYPDYEKIRKTANYALQGINQAIFQYSKLNDIQEKLLVATENESILYNMEKLQDHINKLKSTHKVLPDISISCIQAIIAPEIIAYIDKYGYPSNGVFDTEKMATILLHLFSFQTPINII